MALGMLGSAPPPIAIDFGVGSLKALQLAPGESRALMAAACFETPEELRQDHAARFDYQCQQLGDLLKGAGFRGKRAVCSIPATQTLVQHMQIQKAENVPLATLVMGQLQTQTHCNPAGVVVRHIEVGDFNRGSGLRTEVICIAVSREVVFKQIQALKARRMEVVGVHCEHVALVHSFDRITRRVDDHQLTSLYIDIGAGTTKVAIAHGRRPVFAKTVQVAGGDLDAAVARQMKCSLSEARARRLAMATIAPAAGASASGAKTGEADASPSWAEERQSDDGAAPSRAGAAVATDRRSGGRAPGLTERLATDASATPPAGPDLSSPLESLVLEISMCIRYHERLFPDRPVNRAIFVGGETRHRALCEHVARSLRLPAQIADPLAFAGRTGREPSRGVDLESPQPGWATPLGLCHGPVEQ